LGFEIKNWMNEEHLGVPQQIVAEVWKDILSRPGYSVDHWVKSEKQKEIIDIQIHKIKKLLETRIDIEAAGQLFDALTLRIDEFALTREQRDSMHRILYRLAKAIGASEIELAGYAEQFGFKSNIHEEG